MRRNCPRGLLVWIERSSRMRIDVPQELIACTREPSDNAHVDEFARPTPLDLDRMWALFCVDNENVSFDRPKRRMESNAPRLGALNFESCFELQVHTGFRPLRLRAFSAYPVHTSLPRRESITAHRTASAPVATAAVEPAARFPFSCLA